MFDIIFRRNPYLFSNPEHQVVQVLVLVGNLRRSCKAGDILILLVVRMAFVMRRGHSELLLRGLGDLSDPLVL